MQTRHMVLGGVLAAFVAGGGFAQTATWTGGDDNGVFNSAGNWSPGGTPGGMATVVFGDTVGNLTWSADAQNAAAHFNAADGGATRLDTGAFTWALDGDLFVGDGAGAATAVYLDGGAYQMRGVLATNVSAVGEGTSLIEFSSGVLTTTGDTEIRVPTNGVGRGVNPFRVASQDKDFTWNILGGTTKLLPYGTLYPTHWEGEYENAVNLGFGGGWGSATVNAAGSSTVVTNSLWLHVGRKTWDRGANVTNCVLSISEGAKWYTEGKLLVGWSSMNNRVFVDGEGSLLHVNGTLQVGKNGVGGIGNQMLVSNGGTVVTKEELSLQEGSDPANGFEGGAKVIVSGDGSSLTANSIVIGGNGSSAQLIVEDGGLVTSVGSWKLGNQNNGTNNELVVRGPGSRFEQLGGALWMEGSYNSLIVSNGATASMPEFKMEREGYLARISGPGSVLTLNSLGPRASGRLVIEDGGVLNITGNFEAGGRQYTSTGNVINCMANILVTGEGSAFVSPPTNHLFRIAAYDGSATFRVENKGRFSWKEKEGSETGINIGWATNQTGTLTVTGEGTLGEYVHQTKKGTILVGDLGRGILNVTEKALFRMEAESFRVAYHHVEASGSSVLVDKMGVLDFGPLRQFDIIAYAPVVDEVTEEIILEYPRNVVTNHGGVFQFATATPVINFDPAKADVVMTNATLSFRDIADADVLSSQDASRFGKFMWQGANVFRLDNAMNIDDASQAYTFAATGDARNYAGLELFNGATYRGAAVGVGAGGTLRVSGTGNAVGASLTLAAGASFSAAPGDTLAVQGTLTVTDDAAFDLAFAQAPVEDERVTLITAQAVSMNPRHMTVTIDDQDYPISLRATADGRVTAGWMSMRGTVIMVR